MVLRTEFGGPLCAKKSRATFWPQSALHPDPKSDASACHCPVGGGRLMFVLSCVVAATPIHHHGHSCLRLRVFVCCSTGEQYHPHTHTHTHIETKTCKPQVKVMMMGLMCICVWANYSQNVMLEHILWPLWSQPCVESSSHPLLSLSVCLVTLCSLFLIL